MKKIYAALLVFLTLLSYSYGLSVPPGQKYSPTQLKEDLAYLKQQLFNVHIYPYTELSKAQFGQLFDHIDTQLKDSLNATDFLKLLKPTIAYLSDEHAFISIKKEQLSESYAKEAVFLPIVLSKQGNTYHIAKVLSNATSLQGEVVTQIDNIPIERAVSNCTLFTTGYPNQRSEKALQQFGYLYSFSKPVAQHSFKIRTSGGKTIEVSGVGLQVWLNEQNKQTGWDSGCNEIASYQKYNDAGYISSCSFNANDKNMDSLRNKLNQIFAQIQKDKVKYLFIDVSKNGGGNSAVGDVLIGYFYDKSYRTYKSDWKKSEEYLKLVKSWGFSPGDAYVAAKDGDVLHFDPDTIDPASNPYRFNGKVFIVVGDGTFSSAIMFGTIIKDNHIAQLAGKTPANGHPNHFGEIYNTTLPNTKLELRFGVKEWIRPAGKTKDNELTPDIVVDPSLAREDLIKEVIKKGG